MHIIIILYYYDVHKLYIAIHPSVQVMHDN